MISMLTQADKLQTHRSSGSDLAQNPGLPLSYNTELARESFSQVACLVAIVASGEHPARKRECIITLAHTHTLCTHPCNVWCENERTIEWENHSHTNPWPKIIIKGTTRGESVFRIICAWYCMWCLIPIHHTTCQSPRNTLLLLNAKIIITSICKSIWLGQSF
jgi:hypothetical protein